MPSLYVGTVLDKIDYWDSHELSKFISFVANDWLVFGRDGIRSDVTLCCRYVLARCWYLWESFHGRCTRIFEVWIEVVNPARNKMATSLSSVNDDFLLTCNVFTKQ